MGYGEEFGGFYLCVAAMGDRGDHCVEAQRCRILGFAATDPPELHLTRDPLCGYMSFRLRV